MSDKFLLLFKVPALKKGCICIPLKIAAAISAILTIIYVILSFFEYYSYGSTKVNDQFFFYGLQIYAGVSAGFILFSIIKKDEQVIASLGLMLHTYFVIVRAILFILAIILILIFTEIPFIILIYGLIEFCSMIYFNYIFFCFNEYYGEESTASQNML